MTEKLRVLISGAGIAGLTAAIALRRQGFEVTVVEKAQSIRAGGFLVSLSHHAYHYAEQLGIMPQLKQHDMGHSQSSYYDRRGRELLALDYGRLFQHVDVIQLLRDDFTRVLYQQVKGQSAIYFAETIKSMELRGDKAQVSFSSGRCAEYDLVIGADGLHSVVRQLLFKPAEVTEHYLNLCCAAFRLPNVLGLADKFATHMERDRYMAAFSTGHGDMGAVFVWDSDTRNIPAHHDKLKLLEQTFRHSSVAIRSVLEQAPTGEHIYMDYLKQVDIPRWSKGPAVLLGDAAHCLTLFSGRGAAAAFSGASRLAEALQQTRSVSDALTAYESSMRPVIKSIQPATRRAVRWYVPRNRLVQQLRDNGMRLLPNSWFRNYFRFKYSNI